MKCLNCLKQFPDFHRAPPREKKFCSPSCQVRYWHKTHPDKAKANRDKYRAKKSVKDKMKQYDRKWYHANIEYARQRMRKWRAKNRDKSITSSRNWQKRHPEQVRHINNSRRCRLLKAKGSHTLQEWLDLKEKCGFRCVRCSLCEPEIKLTEDHIIPLTKGGTNYISNIQPLCRSCNASKGNRV